MVAMIVGALVVIAVVIGLAAVLSPGGSDTSTPSPTQSADTASHVSTAQEQAYLTFIRDSHSLTALNALDDESLLAMGYRAVEIMTLYAGQSVAEQVRALQAEYPFDYPSMSIVWSSASYHLKQ